MVKRIFLLALIMCFMVSVSVFAGVDWMSSFNYTLLQGGSYTQTSLGIRIQESVVAMSSVNSVSNPTGTVLAYDLLGGIHFDWRGSTTLVGGVRFSGSSKGFVIKVLGGSKLAENWFYSTDQELVWLDGNYGSIGNFMLGYQITNQFAVRGGLTSFEGFNLRPSIGIESRF